MPADVAVEAATFLEGVAWIEGGVPGPLHVLTLWRGTVPAILALRRADPDRADPLELHLELALTSSGEVAGLAGSVQLVEYHEEADAFYEQVALGAGRPTLPVRHVPLPMRLLSSDPASGGAPPHNA